MYKFKTIIDSFMTAIRRIAAHNDIARAVYLDSIVDVAMYGCSLEHQITDNP